MGNQQSGYPGNPAGYQHLSAPSSNGRTSYSGHGTIDTVSDSSSLSREERAAALEARLSKRGVKKKDLETIKREHWKAYNNIDRQREQEDALFAAAQASVRSSGSQPASASSSSRPSQPRTFGSGSAAATGMKPSESRDAASIRAQRAAMFEKTGNQSKERAAQNREARWNAYNEIEQRQAAAAGSNSASQNNNVILNAPLPFGFPSGGDGGALASASSAPFTAVPYPSSSPSAPSAPTSSPPSASRGGVSPSFDVYFQQQMQYLLGKVRLMPPPTIALIRKILQNLLKAGDQPSAEDAKYRRVKMNNAKIQTLIGEVDGAMELMLAVGFTPQAIPQANGKEEDYLVFPDGQSLDIAQLASQELAPFSPTASTPPAQQ